MSKPVNPDSLKPAPGTKDYYFSQISFGPLIDRYIQLQCNAVNQVKALSSSVCTATPGKFLMVQFVMSQVTQIGESISNLITQVNSMINMAVRNQKGQ